jgi:phosphomannomutase
MSTYSGLNFLSATPGRHIHIRFRMSWAQGRPTPAQGLEADASGRHFALSRPAQGKRMPRRNADRKRLPPPTYLDHDFLGGAFPNVLNERSATAIGQALTVVVDDGELMLAHDGTSAASMLAHHLGTGATLQGADVTMLGAATLDELRFELMHERLKQAAYVTQQIDQPDIFQVHLLDANAETVCAGSELPAVAKLASRDAFMPPVQLGRIVDLAAPDRTHYCQTVITASRLTASRAEGVIVSNAPNPAIHAMLTEMAVALEQRQTNLRLLVVDALHEHSRIGPADRTKLTESVSNALTGSRACMGLVWYSSSQPPDVLDDSGAHVQHADIMALIAASVPDALQGRAILLDEAGKKRLLKRQKTLQPRGQLQQPVNEAIAATMRIARATYGFRHPSSHFFSDFHYSENGLAAALYVAGLTSADRSLSQLIGTVAARHSSDRENDQT